MAPGTPKRILLDHLMNGQLDATVAERRAQGASWADIAEALTTRTGQFVSDESLRRWDDAQPFARETTDAA